MCKGRVSRMRERYAQTVLTFWITFVLCYGTKSLSVVLPGNKCDDSNSIMGVVIVFKPYVGKAVSLQTWTGPEFPGGRCSQISRQTAHEGGKPYAPVALTPQEIFLVLTSVRGWVNPTTIARPEWLCQWKVPVMSSGIERAAFQLVAQCLNQLRHPKRDVEYEGVSP